MQIFNILRHNKQNRQQPADDFKLLFSIPWDLHRRIIDKYRDEIDKVLFFVRCMSRFISMTRFFLCIDTLLLSDEDIFLAQPLLYPLLPITHFTCKSSVIISIYIAVEKCLHAYGNNVLVLSDLRNESRGISASNYAWMFASPTLISE